MKKSTDTLVNELSDCNDVFNFLSKNTAGLTTPNLSEFLDKLLHKKDCSKADIIKKSGLNQVYAYHIFSGSKNPSRKKVLALALAFQLSLQETQYLLKSADSKELYIRNPWDTIIIHALNKKLTVLQTNELLINLSEEKLLE